MKEILNKNKLLTNHGQVMKKEQTIHEQVGTSKEKATSHKQVMNKL